MNERMQICDIVWFRYSPITENESLQIDRWLTDNQQASSLEITPKISYP